jgi:hypothetical protein
MVRNGSCAASEAHMNNNPSQTFRNMIPVLSPYVCVVVLQFLLLYPLHTTMDLPTWDEADYMGQGERFLHGGTLGPISGSPVYHLLYSLIVKVFGTVNSIFYMQYFVKISVSILLLLFLVGHLRSRLLALLLTLIWVVSGVNIWGTVLVYHVALGLFLLALASLNKHRIVTFLLLCLSALTRLEYIFPTLAFAGYLIFTSSLRQTKGQSEMTPPKAGLTLPRFAAFLLTVLLLYVALNVDNFNPGNKRAWVAFNQHYARHEVESGRYNLNPYIDSNVVIQNDFPGANSLTDAFLINPKSFLKHLLRNIAIFPKATIMFSLPYTSQYTLFLLYGALLGFAVTVLTQASVINHRMLFSGLLRVIRDRKAILYLTLVSMTALIPILLVYPAPHYTLVMAPLCLLWLGLACLQVLKIINSPKFTRWSLTALNLLFILSILIVDKPYTSRHGERAVYEQVAQLVEVWPKEKLKLMGVGASWYSSYIGSQNVFPIEPLATVYGEKIENDSSDLRALLKRHNPDVVFINDSLVNSKNFNTDSLEVLNSDQWVKYSVGNDSFYFLKEKFKR